jgi:hypothetical protein
VPDFSLEVEVMSAVTSKRFQKAVKTRARLRMALIGPSGSGKTFTGLKIGQELAAAGKLAVIDSERGSAAKYADLFTFDSIDLEQHSPKDYIDCILAAEAEGYEALVIDSLSHAWMGRDGALEQVDKVVKRSGAGNSFAAWREVTPWHNKLVDTIIGSRMHIIATLRSKTEYVMETNERGKAVPRKVGMAPIQRDGMEYEFDVVGEMNLQNELVISKSRCPALTGGIFDKPGADMAKVLKEWLGSGEALPERIEPPRLITMPASLGAQAVPMPAAVSDPRPQPAAALPASPPTRLEQQLAASIEVAKSTKDIVEDFMTSILHAPTLDVLAAITEQLAQQPEEVRKPLRSAFASRKKYLVANKSKAPAGRSPGQEG